MAWPKWLAHHQDLRTFGGLQGVYESATKDSYGNSRIFSCNYLGENGQLSIDLGGQPISGGPVTIDVDGIAYSMTALASDGLIATDCSVCGKNYMALWKATAAGSLMTIKASDGRSAMFSLKGSRDALGDMFLDEPKSHCFRPAKNWVAFFKISLSSFRSRFSRRSRSFSLARSKSSFETTSVCRCALPHLFSV